MRKLIWLVLAAALAWSVWWFIGSTALQRGVEATLDNMRANGWQVETAGIRTRGFPNRFDTTITEPVLTTPDGRITWQAPFFQALALSYQPNRLIAVFPDTQRLAGPFGTLDIASARARGSVTLSPLPALPLDHSQFVIDDLRVTAGGETASIGTLLFATRLPPGDTSGRTHNLGLEIDDLRLPAHILEGRDVPGLVPQARIDATLSFDRPLDRAALEDAPPRLTEIELIDASLRWGSGTLGAEGALQINIDGYPTGEIALEVGDWREALRLAAAMGWIDSGREGFVRSALEVYAATTDAADDLRIPLAFRDRRVFLGPLPIGAAPRF